MNKTIYAAYEELKRQEIKELKNAVRIHGGEYVFNIDEGEAPSVLCNLKYGGPADVRILSVSLDGNDHLTIIGQPYCDGPAGWWEDEQEIPLDDIAYSHVSFITDCIPDKDLS